MNRALFALLIIAGCNHVPYYDLPATSEAQAAAERCDALMARCRTTELDVGQCSARWDTCYARIPGAKHRKVEIPR